MATQDTHNVKVTDPRQIASGAGVTKERLVMSEMIDAAVKALSAKAFGRV